LTSKQSQQPFPVLENSPESILVTCTLIIEILFDFKAVIKNAEAGLAFFILM
jgi:hypothetical protein